MATPRTGLALALRLALRLAHHRTGREFRDADLVSVDLLGGEVEVALRAQLLAPHARQLGADPRLHRDRGGVAPGLGFSARWLLRGGIVLFGFSLTVQQLMALGPKVVLLDSLVVVTITTAGYWLGTRWLKLDRDTAILTSAGSAICGAAAVLATEGTIRSRPAATSMAAPRPSCTSSR